MPQSAKSGLSDIFNSRFQIRLWNERVCVWLIEISALVAAIFLRKECRRRRGHAQCICNAVAAIMRTLGLRSYLRESDG